MQATPPFVSPSAFAGQPASTDQASAQRAEFLLGQQQWMHRQMREAMQNMRRDGIDLLNAN
eukprot:1403991-Pyramimonas_sp.AAC.1